MTDLPGLQEFKRIFGGERVSEEIVDGDPCYRVTYEPLTGKKTTQEDEGRHIRFGSSVSEVKTAVLKLADKLETPILAQDKEGWVTFTFLKADVEDEESLEYLRRIHVSAYNPDSKEALKDVRVISFLERLGPVQWELAEQNGEKVYRTAQRVMNPRVAVGLIANALDTNMPLPPISAPGHVVIPSSAINSRNIDALNGLSLPQELSPLEF